MEPTRFFPAVAIGGGAAAGAMAIPVFGDLLRCCFCVGVMLGAAASMKIWLDRHPAESLDAQDAATLGACSGAVTAAATWLLSVPVRLAFGEALSGFYATSSLPTLVRVNLQALYTPSAFSLVMSLPVQLGLFGVMGAVGAFVALETVFKDRKSTS